MPSTDQPTGQDEESNQRFVHSIDPMKNEIALLCAHVSVKVQCGHDRDHEFYLPFKVTQHEASVSCPICKKCFPPCKGRYDFNNVDWLRAQLEKLVLLLPPTTKDELRRRLKE